MLRLARLDGSVAVEEEGTRGGARMKGLYFHINDFMTASFHPRGAAASVVAAAATTAREPVGNLYFIVREILAIYSRIRI